MLPVFHSLLVLMLFPGAAHAATDCPDLAGEYVGVQPGTADPYPETIESGTRDGACTYQFSDLPRAAAPLRIGDEPVAPAAAGTVRLVARIEGGSVVVDMYPVGDPGYLTRHCYARQGDEIHRFTEVIQHGARQLAAESIALPKAAATPARLADARQRISSDTAGSCDTRQAQLLSAYGGLTELIGQKFSEPDIQAKQSAAIDASFRRITGLARICAKDCGPAEGQGLCASYPARATQAIAEYDRRPLESFARYTCDPCEFTAIARYRYTVGKFVSGILEGSDQPEFGEGHVFVGPAGELERERRVNLRRCEAARRQDPRCQGQ